MNGNKLGDTLDQGLGTSNATIKELVIDVPPHGWTIHIAPTGHLYAFNHVTKHADWRLPRVHPEPPFAPFPPPIPKYRIQTPPKEKALKKVRFPKKSPWYAVWTDVGNVFLYNKITKRSTWRPTPDLAPIFKELIASEEAKLTSADLSDEESTFSTIAPEQIPHDIDALVSKYAFMDLRHCF
jgi:hypothetical protein